MPNAIAASMAKQPNSKTDCQVETAKETTFSLFDIPGQTFLRQNSVPISLSYFLSVIPTEFRDRVDGLAMVKKSKVNATHLS
jgi:hypothetical protein